MSTNVHENNINSKTIWIGLAAVIVVIGGLWLGLGLLSTGSESSVTNNAVANNLEPAPKAGHPAPNFTLTNVEGQQVSLSDFQGKPVIINFWATWCGPCRVEMPHLQEAFADHQGNDEVVVLGVNLTERDDAGAVPGFMEEFGLTFPVVLDEAGEVTDIYNVFGQPASVFVDKHGVVYELFYGPINRNFIETKISEMLSL